MKPARILFVLLLLTGIGVGVYWRDGRPTPAVDPRLTLYGNIDLRDAQLAFMESELVTDMLVQEGDQVKKGQVLAHLRRARLEDQRNQAKAQLAAQQQTLARLQAGSRPQAITRAHAELEAAQAQQRLAQKRVDRIKFAANAGASSKDELDDAISQLDIAKAQCKARQQTLELAILGPRQEDIDQAKAVFDADKAVVQLLEQRLEDTMLIAPSEGVIQSRILEPGEMASPDRPAYVLALSNPKWVRAYLPEPDLGRIKLGMQAKVHSDSFPEKTYDGWIGFISPQAEFTPKAVQTTDLRTQLVYEVRVWMKDPDNQLRLGMPVTVKLDPDAPPHVPNPSTDGQ